MGLIGGMARTAVIAGTATAVSNNVSRRQAQRWSSEEADKQAAAQAQQAPVQSQPVSSAASVDDQVAQIEKLASLKEQGILTEAEFQAKKAEILGL